MPYLTPADRIYLELSQPALPTPPARPVAPRKVLTRDDVRAILERRRGASPAELEDIINRAKEFGLTREEHNWLSVELTIRVSEARQGNGRREDPNARFIAQVLGYLETPFGLIDRSFIEQNLREGSASISRCRKHKPPLCDCWSAQRAILFHAQAQCGEKSPEWWAATRIYDTLCEIEQAARAEVALPPVPGSAYHGGYQAKSYT